MPVDRLKHPNALNRYPGKTDRFAVATRCSVGTVEKNSVLSLYEEVPLENQSGKVKAGQVDI